MSNDLPYTLHCVINLPTAEVAFQAEPVMNLGALEDTISQIIADHEEATSFVFTVVPYAPLKRIAA